MRTPLDVEPSLNPGQIWFNGICILYQDVLSFFSAIGIGVAIIWMNECISSNNYSLIWRR